MARDFWTQPDLSKEKAANIVGNGLKGREKRMSGKGKSHKAYPAEFKAKCVRELLDGDETLPQVASRNGLAPSVLSKWRSQVLENMDATLGAEAERRREAEAERARAEEAGDLNRIIGQLAVERDYLQREARRAVGARQG